ncbi:MAG TPA: cytochrome c3 family protein [Candidatus Acidoferrales bacterium]|nr:cytochrome c3 family protein [Candidatus Acidoferrales bacterium]
MRIPARRIANPPQVNNLPHITVFLCLLVCLQPVAAQTPRPQPVAFSHKVHAGTLKLKCKTCHANPDPGETMGVAAASMCMQCHSAIKTDSPDIQKLAAAAKDNKELPWLRVYWIPSYVNFSHRTHLETGNQCEDCHGKVAERDKLAREGNISMGGCMACHQTKKVSIDCGYCHEPK